MMSSNEISQIKIVDSIDQNVIEDDILIKSSDSFEISEKNKGEWEDLSSRIDIWDEKNTRKISKKSFMLLAKNYPNYHHYSYKVGLLNRYHKMPEPYAVLPEIKGHTLSNIDREHHNLKQIPNNISLKLNTLQDLTNNILKYGSKTDNIWMKFGGSRYGQKLVRPGFSARRYMANLVRHLNDNIVEKLIADGKVLEKTIFQNSIILPHIRRRLSADLSRYPEPYRILKQMLISPGPLNEYSFIWKKSDYFTEEMPSTKISEMNVGDIKILSKKSLGDNTDIFEEVQYAQMSHEKKKTVLSNLLLKSAMNHALKMKEEIVVHNSKTIDKSSKENVHNIHIPIINFDMMEAVTDLLNKETFEMLSNKDASLMDKSGFKGQALRTNYVKGAPHLDLDKNIMSETLDSRQNVYFDQVNNEEHSADLVPVNLIPNLTLRLNPTNVNRSNHKKKELKIENPSGQQSSLSNYQNAVISFDTSGLPDYQSQMEAQSNAFVERLKNKTGKSGVSHQAKPYGKYRDTEEISIDRDSNAVGDIDPTSSFKNWKYEESKNTNSEFGKGFDSSSLSSSGNFTTNSLFNSKTTRKVSKGKLIDLNSKSDEESLTNLSVQNDQNRLFNLLNEHADTVAEKVLISSGGEDFASDVKEAVIQWNEILKERYFELFSYVAIMEILQQRKSLLNQSHESNGQIWNLDVQDLHNEQEYGGMIKNIFKSLFKEQLDGVTNDDVNISPEIMLLLQDGSRLALDNIEVKIDSITGKTVITLKEESMIKRETLSQMQKENNNNLTRNMNYSKLSNTDISETLPLSSHLQNVGQIFSSPSSIIITPTWDEGTLSNENKGNLPRIIESNLKSELKNSSDLIGISSQNLSKFNISQENSTSVNDTQNHSTPLSYNQTPSVKFDENLILEESGQRSGDKSNAMPNFETLVKKSNSSIENDKNNFSSTSLKNELQKSTSKKSKQEFIVGRVDDVKDVLTLYSQSPEKLTNEKIHKQTSQKQLGKIVKQKPSTNKKSKQDNQKSKKKVINKIYNDNEPLPLAIKSDIINKIEVVEPKTETETLIEKEDNESIELYKESSNHSVASASKYSQDFMSEKYDDDIDQIDEDASGDDEESKQRKILMRQQREAKRKAGADKRRLEVERKRREKEEQRISDLKRKELEESLAKKLEEERRQREEEYRLKMEQEKAEELLRMQALDQEEYLRLKKIERERKDKEEFNRRLEEMKMKQALEEQKRKVEQERLAFEESERIRIENEMISRMRENERVQYLKNKAEEEERRRLKEEEEKRLKEEQARLALEEAQRIVQQQARERAELEARLNFLKGLRIENAGLKKFLNVTPNFVWSYFEFLKILGLQSNPTTSKLESEKYRTS